MVQLYICEEGERDNGQNIGTTQLEGALQKTCTITITYQCQDLRVLILSRIVNRHMELQTNEGHPFEGRKGMGRFDIVLVFCYTRSQAKSKKVIT